MISQLRAKLRRRSGFTLVEILIVVAIIAVLVAVSIPLVTGALERTRVAADQANERSAEAAAKIYMLTEWDGQSHILYYRAETGTFERNPQNDKLTPYGQCDRHEGCAIRVTISADETMTLEWIKLYGAGSGYEGIPEDPNREGVLIPPHSLDGSVPDP